MISVIVPVYNRAGEVEELLGSFLKQTSGCFEIVIVDDGSTDDLKSVVEKFSTLLKLQYVCHRNRGPGLSRNEGMKAARGEFFVFMDSDCTVPPDYIESLCDHLDNEEFDVFGGRDTSRPDFPAFLKAVDYCMTSFLGTAGSRTGSKSGLVKYYPRSFNMGIKKEVYDEIGGMIDLRHGQDMEYSSRIYKAGFKVRYFEDVYVYHKRRTDLRKYFKQIFNWGLARHNLRRFDRKLLRPVHALPSIVVLGILVSLVCYLIWERALILILGEVALLTAVLLFIMIQSAFRYGSIKVGILAPVVFLTQILAYGTGFLAGWLKSIFSRDKNFIEGFRKNYYK